MKQATFYVNGKRHSVVVEEHEMLSDVIRNKIGLTGTKEGCSQGSCGACTVLVNNEAVLSCITPAMRYDRANILTIEGVARADGLHGLQQKFVEKGAIQCGFCTPGMVITAIDFLNNNPAPTIDEIKMALSGNLCRCTGYTKIIEAVAEYAKERNSHKEDQVSEVIADKRTVGVGRPYWIGRPN